MEGGLESTTALGPRASCRHEAVGLCWNCSGPKRAGKEAGGPRSGASTLQATKRFEDSLLHGGRSEISYMAASVEHGQGFRAKRGLKPGQVFLSQQEVVSINDHANVAI